jgi:hypothetical protein
LISNLVGFFSTARNPKFDTRVFFSPFFFRHATPSVLGRLREEAEGGVGVHTFFFFFFSLFFTGNFRNCHELRARSCLLRCLSAFFFFNSQKCIMGAQMFIYTAFIQHSTLCILREGVRVPNNRVPGVHPHATHRFTLHLHWRSWLTHSDVGDDRSTF